MLENKYKKCMELTIKMDIEMDGETIKNSLLLCRSTYLTIKDIIIMVYRMYQDTRTIQKAIDVMCCVVK